MRRIIRFILFRPVMWAAQKFSSRPERERIFKALDKLSADSVEHPGKKGLALSFDASSGRIIIFSDQHKGARDGADDFLLAEPNYLAALNYYNTNDYFLVCMGDSEELWENNLARVKKFNRDTFEAEKRFLVRNAFAKVIGNHDLYWGNDPFAWWQLKKIYGQDVKIYEAVMLSTTIASRPFQFFCTHGHQGDAQSDGNWFSKFFVARVWAPLQAYLRINPNTAAYNNEKKTLHNEIMYEWSARQRDLLLITGHTHQPVFGSLTLLEKLYKDYQQAQKMEDANALAVLRDEITKREKEFAAVSADYLTMRPSYFNSGCCCFVDGDITGIELADGFIRLIKWTNKSGASERVVLEEKSLEELVRELMEAG